MTQEQYMRLMFRSFVDDPPDSDFQNGYLSAGCVIAQEVMGFDANDEDLVKARNLLAPAAKVVADLERVALRLIKGGRNDGQ